MSSNSTETFDLRSALLTQCDEVPEYFEGSYFGVFGILVITIAVELLGVLIEACQAKKGKKKKKKKNTSLQTSWFARVVFFFTIVNILLVFVGIYDYFSHGLPTGSPTCGFLFTMSLPLYKPLAAPLWRTLETMIPFFIEEKGDAKAFVVIFMFFAIVFAPISIALFVFSIPLFIVFIPSTLVILLLFIAIYLAFGLLLIPCAGTEVFRADKLGDFCNSLPAKLIKVGTFLGLGTLIYFSALYGSFYHGNSWSSVFNYSKNYLDFGDVIPSFTWPSEISMPGKIVLGAGAASAGAQSLAQILDKLDWWSEKLQAVATTAVNSVPSNKKDSNEK